MPKWQYMPNGIDISSYSQPQLNAIARQLNQRPRKTLRLHTPAGMFNEHFALTS
jgi:IS30 family transposase